MTLTAVKHPENTSGRQWELHDEHGPTEIPIVFEYEGKMSITYRLMFPTKKEALMHAVRAAELIQGFCSWPKRS